MNIILESPTACLLEKYGKHFFQDGLVSFELKMELKNSSFDCLFN